jgi:hypothetical protein
MMCTHTRELIQDDGPFPLGRLEILKYCSDECLRAIAHRMIHLTTIYMPGDYVVKAGQIGLSLLVRAV